MPRKKGAHDATRRGRGGEEKFVAPISQPTTTLLSRSRIRSLQPKRFQFFCGSQPAILLLLLSRMMTGRHLLFLFPSMGVRSLLSLSQRHKKGMTYGGRRGGFASGSTTEAGRHLLYHSPPPSLGCHPITFQAHASENTEEKRIRKAPKIPLGGGSIQRRRKEGTLFFLPRY